MLEEPLRDTVMAPPHHICCRDEALLEHLLGVGHSFNLMNPGKPEIMPSSRVTRHLAYPILIQKQPCLGHTHRYHRNNRGDHPRFPNRLFDLGPADLMSDVVGITMHDNKINGISQQLHTCGDP